VTAGTDRAPSLRTTLRELQAALDSAAAEHLAHRGEHGCREGSGCHAGEYLSARVADLQGRLGMTRFASEEG